VHESSLLSTSNDTKHTPNKSIKRQSMSRPLSRKKSLIAPAITEYELDLLHLGDEEEMDKIFNKPGMKLERKNSKSLKATIGPVHAIWYNLITKKAITKSNLSIFLKKGLRQYMIIKIICPVFQNQLNLKK
jgi:hypothetical protein